MTIENPTMAGYEFLTDMYASDYFPDALVAKGEAILRELCERVEAERPADLPAIYALTHEATVRFNDLQEDFWEADSEIEPRSVSRSPFIASVQENISITTLSVTSPIPRTNSCVGSTTGVRTLA